MLWKHKDTSSATTDASLSSSRNNDSNSDLDDPQTAVHAISSEDAADTPLSKVRRLDHSSTEGIPQWQLASCEVTPAFSSGKQDTPAGVLAFHLTLEQLFAKPDPISMADFMTWANTGSCAPPVGF